MEANDIISMTLTAASLLDRWEAEIDVHGRIYYFNRFRKQSVWQEEAEMLPPGSLVGKDDTGGEYVRSSQIIAFRKLQARKAERPEVSSAGFMERNAYIGGSEAVASKTTIVNGDGIGNNGDFVTPAPSKTPDLSQKIRQDEEEEFHFHAPDPVTPPLSDDEDAEEEDDQQSEEYDNHVTKHRNSSMSLDSESVDHDVSNSTLPSVRENIAATVVSSSDNLEGNHHDNSASVWISTYDARGYKYFFDLASNKAEWTLPKGIASVDVHELLPPSERPPQSIAKTSQYLALTNDDMRSSSVNDTSAADGNDVPGPSLRSLRQWKINDGLVKSGVLGVPFKCSGKWKKMLDQIINDSKEASIQDYAMRYLKISPSPKVRAVLM